MKQKQKAKICFVIYIAGEKKLLFYIYAVIVKQIFYKRSTNHYCPWAARGRLARGLGVFLIRLRGDPEQPMGSSD